ncbi:hypothetical protein J2Z48_000327 [Croceifilum oryzae]|uniref:DUF4440 domain-containing protein n=1 Tax=Croceifilum oryzae TaxID=1553429 RepID=A0AAJ1TD21_9BACL|nr:DUF4440 domain-containing protein [Croceifilum oryzae]MDQ0416169.1 hypothetical protein [Croceifilum oryzae]
MNNTDLAILENYLFELETTLLKPTKELYEKYLSDTYFEFGSSGNVWVRKDYDMIGSRDTRKLTLTQFQLHPLADDVVMVTYRIHDEIRELTTLRSSIWKQFNRKWKMVFHQGTPTQS